MGASIFFTAAMIRAFGSLQQLELRTEKNMRGLRMSGNVSCGQPYWREKKMCLIQTVWENLE
jgi:hypothetical protein